MYHGLMAKPMLQLPKLHREAIAAALSVPKARQGEHNSHDPEADLQFAPNQVCNKRLHSAKGRDLMRELPVRCFNRVRELEAIGQKRFSRMFQTRLFSRTLVVAKVETLRRV